MTIRVSSARHCLIGILAVALVATSGCSWFRGKKDPYKNAPENRPLEVPPDLDAPNVDPAMQIPALASRQAGRGTAGAAPEAATGGPFVLAEAIAGAWRRVGQALDDMEGVVVGTRSQALGTLEVQYQGQTFLVRLRAQDSSTAISAVSGDGRVLGEGPALSLLAALRARLN